MFVHRKPITFCSCGGALISWSNQENGFTLPGIRTQDTAPFNEDEHSAPRRYCTTAVAGVCMLKMFQLNEKRASASIMFICLCCSGLHVLLLLCT